MIREDAKRYGIYFPRCILSWITGNTFFANMNYRMSNWLYRHHIKLLPEIINSHSRKKFGCEISPYATIGCGLFIPHTQGIVIGHEVVIGNNGEIFQNVTIGSNRRPINGRYMPIIGNNVSIGAGAVVVGAITIGDNVKIGANSYVDKDVPSNVIVVGSPAKIIKML